MEVVHRKVMVTGGTGFIGSHLVCELVRSFDVVVPYIEVDSKSIFAQKKLQKKVKLEKVNILDFEKIDKLISSSKVDYIIHLAAQPLVTLAYDFPYETINTNIMGTVNVLEAARRYGKIKGIIVASSDKAYGQSSSGYKEGDPLLGKHPYDVSKTSGDLTAQAYFETYGLPVVITRFGNVYGEGDLHFDRLVPGLMKSVIGGRTFEIRSDGKYRRDYIYVKDVALGYLLLLSKIDRLFGQAFNFSSSDNLSVIDVLKLTEKSLGVKIKYKILNETRNEILSQHLDGGKIKKLGWKQESNFADSIKDVYDWYKETLK